ncbi:hypothetical protein [Cellulomonas sp. HD19AZ1]|uniref:hypothetical protein n=1 Tax=Cellulomonas sp. HD19AZ1 TaxID=2559593 RepID=UPI00107070C2|nr:hypothetical protein [Cellulomonas sp. HD19AZ1]TFH70026.1 hypothetical protein E4A51_14460 [Cellulomonas sp. HD19AZ1]
MDDTREPRDTPRDEGTTAAADDAAVARVRAADPAAGTTPDLPRLHARLAETTGVTFTAAAPADELAAARRRRSGPARWAQVAAAVVAVGLVGGGGYAVGAAGGGPAPAAPPIALQGASSASGGALEAAGASAFADSARIAPGWFGGRTVFTADGVTGDAGTGRAWAFDATGAATRATAARVAEVLGVTGEPRQEWGQWVVGPNDGSGPTVSLGVDGQAGMWFYDRAWDPSVCTAGDPGDAPSIEPAPVPDGADDGATIEPGVGIAPVQPDEVAPADPSVCDPTTTPRGAAAESAARDLLTRLGVDLGDAEVTVTDDTGVAGLVAVTAAQVVDGTQTGVVWSVQLAGKGVQAVSGPLAPLVELGTYDVISAAAAVERLNDPRFGASYGGVVPLAARMTDDTAEPAVPQVAPEPDEPTVPPVPAAGAAVPWPVQHVTLTAARLGVTLLTTPDGASLLVPAWELSDADGGTWSVVAVAEDQLDLSAG